VRNRRSRDPSLGSNNIDGNLRATTHPWLLSDDAQSIWQGTSRSPPCQGAPCGYRSTCHDPAGAGRDS
jgi:hypothetical protein